MSSNQAGLQQVQRSTEALLHTSSVVPVLPELQPAAQEWVDCKLQPAEPTQQQQQQQQRQPQPPKSIDSISQVGRLQGCLECSSGGTCCGRTQVC
jgi:hypothetical protein